MALSNESRRNQDWLDKIARRALLLLKESDHPQREMQWAENRLWQEGLWQGNPPDPKNLFQWTEHVIAQNPEMTDQDVPFWLQQRALHPERAETFESLILQLIPKEGGL